MSRPEDHLQVYQDAKRAGKLGINERNSDYEGFNSVKVTFSSVPCQVIVYGGPDPVKEECCLFAIEFKPKGLVFPEDVSEGDMFRIGEGAGSVADLREFLAGGTCMFYGSEQWYYMDDEDVDRFVRPLPPPFNDPEAQVELTWTKDDVSYDQYGKLIVDLYDRAFTEPDLINLDVGELRTIVAIKSGETDTGLKKKAELIQMISDDQASKGLKARFGQMTL